VCTEWEFIGELQRACHMTGAYEPAYLRLFRSGELGRRAAEARGSLRDCILCPRECRVDRVAGGVGACRIGEQAIVCSYHAHFGEEAPLVGRHGSGTIFFSGCNLSCQYCQNHEISQGLQGVPVDAESLASMMLALQAAGCHNINLVSPSHVVAQFLAGLFVAVAGGLRLPVVYNSGGYDSIATLRLLDGIVDIYMPDMKYADERAGWTYSKVPSYPSVNRAAVKEMHRQVGDLLIDARDVAIRGLLVRHLVLPHGLAGTMEVAGFLAREVCVRTYVNVMDQYRPCYRAHAFSELNRRVNAAEYEEAVAAVKAAGLHRLDERKPDMHWLMH
jgi:putative pyruvate formate lyase activating enzyme